MATKGQPEQIEMDNALRSEFGSNRHPTGFARIMNAKCALSVGADGGQVRYDAVWMSTFNEFEGCIPMGAPNNRPLQDPAHSNLTQTRAGRPHIRKRELELARELANPLTATSNYLNAAIRLHREHTQSAPTKLSDVLAKSRDQIERASAILRRLRASIEKSDIPPKARR